MSVKTVVLSAILATIGAAATTPQPPQITSQDVSVQTSRPAAPRTGTRDPAPPITLNAVDASFLWWYSKTATQPVSTISILFNEDDQRTGWTLVPPTTTWDISTAISTWECPTTQATLSLAKGGFATYSICDYAARRVAASTTGVYVDAYRRPSQTSGTDTTTLPNVAVSFTSPAQIAFTGVPTTIAPGTPFVFFTAYEAVGTTCSSQASGGKVCRAICETSRLSEPYVFKYTGPNPADAKDFDAVVTGKLDPAFPSFVQQASAVAGTWAAPPTVIVVVVRVIVAVAVLAAHVEESASSLAIPSYSTPTAFTRLENVATDTPEPTSKAPKPTSNSPAVSSRSEQQDNSQADPASYIATGIGIPYSSSAASPAQTPGANSPHNNAVASSSTSASYTPGNVASASSYSIEALALGIGSFLLAIAYG